MNKAERFFTGRAASVFATPDAFEQFLGQQHPESIVGYAKDSCQCPISTFAKSLRMPIVSVTFGHGDIELGRRYAVLGVNLDGQPHLYAEDTESWFVDFVWAVGSTASAGSRNYSTTGTGDTESG